ncbi:DCC1-like thiol-disulfide oxidoreductase family protein [Fulvivirga sp.]|uniref:thiol-disulfide oxidoreductase DCC family protein n=1 Tax=Fulvivirga sp. TaxID=1931237 RepID=UPI0032EB89A1
MGTSTQIENPFNKHVIFFDGYCNLCNSSVDFVMRRDKEAKFLFESLQADYTQERIAPKLPKNTDSIVVWTSSGQILLKSSAAIFIALQLGGWLKLFAVFRPIPASLRDVVYMFISKNRYRWFGKKNTCRLPNANERARFLEAYQNI